MSETLFWESIASWLKQLFLLCSWFLLVLQAGIGAGCKLRLKLFDAACRVDELQLACVERMAHIANIDAELFANTFGNETVSATASYLSLDVVWVNFVFHVL